MQIPFDPDLAGLASTLSAPSSSFFINPFSPLCSPTSRQNRRLSRFLFVPAARLIDSLSFLFLDVLGLNAHLYLLSGEATSTNDKDFMF